MTYIATLIPIFILALSIGLGFSKENWFIEFGLAIVVISAVTSMILAFLGGRKASQAEKVSYESYAPVIDEKVSHSFKFVAGMYGVDPRNPLKNIEDKVDELRKVAAADEKNFRDQMMLANYRIDICLAQMRYHEDVTLPKILGQGAGAIILAGVLAIIGSVYLAVPTGAYQVFAGVAGTMRAWLPAL